MFGISFYGTGADRFPRPDFNETKHQIPVVQHAHARLAVFEYLDTRNPKNGDIFLNNGIITKFNFQKNIQTLNNSIFFIQGKKLNFNIGCNNIEHTEYLFYDLPFLWSECVYLNNGTLELLHDLILPHELKTLFFFEVINKLLDKSIFFENTIIPKSQITKINNIKDIKKLKAFV